MKPSRIETTLYIIGILCMFFPWIIGLIDMWAYFFTGGFATSIPWNGERMLGAFFWPIFIGGLLLSVGL